MRFEIYPVPRIQFGAGVLEKLPEAVRALGARALVVHSADALLPRLGELLKEIEIVCFRQRGEPTTEDVEGAVRLAKQHGAECLVALGGGSAIDCAKATAGLLTNGGAPLDYMEVVGRGKTIQRPSAPWIAIPTTAGTGAEATRNAVIALSSAANRFKASIRSEHLLPRLILIDPQLHVGVPGHVTARSGMDALCQCIESYTSRNANPVTDSLALRGISLCARSLVRCFQDGQDLNAREDMALAALLSGICLTNAGLGAVHGFAAPLGALFPVPHGVVCGALLPHVIRENIEALREEDASHPVLLRYADVGRLLSADPLLDRAPALRAAVERSAKLLEELHIPRLGKSGVRESDVAAVVPLAKQASSMRFNPVALSDEALGRAMRDAL